MASYCLYKIRKGFLFLSHSMEAGSGVGHPPDGPREMRKFNKSNRPGSGFLSKKELSHESKISLAPFHRNHLGRQGLRLRALA